MLRLLLLGLLGLARGQEEGIPPPFTFIWDAHSSGLIFIKPAPPNVNWSPDAEAVEFRLPLEGDRAALGLRDEWTELFNFRGNPGSWDRLILAATLPHGACFEYGVRLRFANGSATVEQGLPPPAIRLQDGGPADRNRIRASVRGEPGSLGADFLVRFTFGERLNTDYATEVVRTERWLAESGCGSVKREVLPAPRLSGSFQESSSAEYRIDRRYAQYDCAFRFGLNYTLRIPGKAGTLRPTCERTFTVDDAELRLSCRDPAVRAAAGDIACRPPLRLCDMECGPSRVWSSVSEGQLERLAPANRNHLLRVDWEFPPPANSIFSNLVSEADYVEYQFRWGRAQLRDDGSLASASVVSTGTNVPDKTYVTIPVSFAEGSANYTLQVCAMRERGCDRISWDAEPLFAVEWVDPSDGGPLPPFRRQLDSEATPRAASLSTIASACLVIYGLR